MQPSNLTRRRLGEGGDQIMGDREGLHECKLAKNLKGSSVVAFAQCIKNVSLCIIIISDE